MTTLFRIGRRGLLPALLLLAGTGRAQVAPVRPLSSDPARAVYAPTPAALRARGGTSLGLPFFDDFTTPLEGAPKPTLWVPGGGPLVNNRFALRPLTRGTATLDGLRANGRSYSDPRTVAFGAIDSLTSQPIDLSGLAPANQVALSFAWQAGSVVGTPRSNLGNRPVSLELLVRTATNTWESKWQYLSQGRATGFRQQVVLLDQAKYLHGSFQFRFVARGNTADNSDTWNVDYVLLDRGRSAGLADTTHVDVATSAGLVDGNPSGGLRSPLRRFTAMPVWQFNAAPAPTGELTPRLGVNVTNLRPGPLPLPVGVQGTVRDLTAGATLGFWLQQTRLLTTTPRLDSVTGNAARQPVPRTPTAKRLRYTLALNSSETTPRTLPNDTISRDVDLSNYYAYDDGTYENVTGLVAYSLGQPTSFAYRFDLNQPDHVRGLRLYPVFNASDLGPRPVSISVWDDDAGRPAAQPKATKSFVIPSPLPSGWDYIELSFDVPVPVTGALYVGYTQPSTGRDLFYGLDLNSRMPAGRFWYRNNVGMWDTTSFSGPGQPYRGALMMRPVMSNNVTTATAATRESAAFGLYPNPARGSVHIAGPPFARAAVLDALGRTVWLQPTEAAGNTTLQLPTLPAGVYTVRLTLPNGATVGRRLLLE